jgi:glycosyltransferase involved in cell wall biosynthesis
MATVTIGVPVYNGAHYVAAALDCLIAQTFQDIEILVSDNASTDATGEIVRGYAARDPRIKYFRNDRNIGAQPNYNRTFDNATGKYLKWHACDDLIAPSYIEKCVALLEADPSAVLCHSETGLIDDTGALLHFDAELQRFTDKERTFSVPGPDPHFADSDDPFARFCEALLRTLTCQHVMALMRADAARKTGYLATYYSADRAFLVEMAMRGKFCLVPETLFFKREHARNSRQISSAKAKSAWSGAPAWIGALDFLHGYINICRGLLRTDLSVEMAARCLGFAIYKALSGKLGRPLAPIVSGLSRLPLKGDIDGHSSAAGV